MNSRKAKKKKLLQIRRSQEFFQKRTARPKRITLLLRNHHSVEMIEKLPVSNEGERKVTEDLEKQ
jgi:hypothetical protein